jgi:FkbM family methyltransferase
MSEQVAANFRAQFGEDRLLAEYFGKKSQGFFVEVGAYNGVDFSNSYYFEQLGWHGVLVEPDPEMSERCRQSRKHSQVVECAVVGNGCPPVVTFDVIDGWKALSALSFRAQIDSEKVPPELTPRKITVAAKTLDQILDECCAGEIDFVTIDVEGDEWGVLQGFTIDRWQPQIVILERHSARPEQNILNYMHRGRYRYLRTTGGINDWYCRSAEAPGAFYHIWLFCRVILPGLIMERMIAPIIRASRQVLSQCGLLEAARSLRRKDRTGL